MSLNPFHSDMIGALKPVLETALDAVVVMRQDGTVAAWNEVAERSFGWTAAEAVGQLMADLIVPPQHRDAHCQGLERYNRTREEHVLNQRIEISAIDKAGREFPVELSITTAPWGDDIVFIGFLRDITARRDAETRLRRQARETQLLFEVTRLAAETESFEEALKASLEAICDLTGWPVGHALVVKGEGVAELVSASVWHENVAGAASALKRVTAGLRFTPGVGMPGIILQTGEPMWVSDAETDANFPRKGLGFSAAFGFPIKSDGKTIAVLEFFSQASAQPDPDLLLIVRTLGEQVGRVLERKRREAHRTLLIHELNHRVKNTLAVVQSVAAQTFKDGAAEPAAMQAFDSRLAALAAAHDLLTAENWKSASIEDVIVKAGLGCGAEGDRMTIAGPPLRLPPRTAVSLAMALHELCTNAVKYGALSREGGTVSVSWTSSDAKGAPRLRLEWREQGGPPVVPPGTRGFGSRMIERALAAELGGKVVLDFAADGLRCTVDAPLPKPDEEIPAG